MSTRNILLTVLLLVVVAGGGYVFFNKKAPVQPSPTPTIGWYNPFDVGGQIKAITPDSMIIEDRYHGRLTLNLIGPVGYYDEDSREIASSSFKVGQWMTSRVVGTLPDDLKPEWIMKWIAPGETLPPRYQGL